MMQDSFLCWGGGYFLQFGEDVLFCMSERRLSFLLHLREGFFFVFAIPFWHSNEK